MTNDTEERAEYTAGLRAIADLLEQHEAVPLPFEGTLGDFTVFCEDKAELVAFRRAIGGSVAKSVDADSSSYGFTLTGCVGSITLRAKIHRDEVCRRVVTGTREVTKTVPAPDAPMVEVTETVEDVEWVCEPLLTEAVSA